MSQSEYPSESIVRRSDFPAERASQWQLRSRRLDLPICPLIMGIVNVTPDSFSDGGKFQDTCAATDYALQLAEAGADILDVGGESTRPYSDPVPLDEELRRVIPVVASLCRQTSVPVSVDTSKAVVAKAALDVGVEIINDVTGLESDAEMLEVARSGGAGWCVMHMQGSPQTMQDNPTYENVVEEVLGYLKIRQRTLLDAGIEPARICLDPGIGFGKTHQHNITLVANANRFHTLGAPVLVGHSRKGFLAKLIGDKQADRTTATIGVALTLAGKGVQILRVHDVRPVREALRACFFTGGIDGTARQLEDT
jgi:dihydropteroate synthase